MTAHSLLQNKYINAKAGRLKVIDYLKGSQKNSVKIYAKLRCICDCGVEKLVSIGDFNSGRVLSCGCYKNELQEKHELSSSSEYNAWIAMRARCAPRSKDYDYYGGRGICVYPEWEISFRSFINYIGLKPEPKYLYSLDRINNNGNYEPGNIRWATKSEQCYNRRALKVSEMLPCIKCGIFFKRCPSKTTSKHCSWRCRSSYSEEIHCQWCCSKFKAKQSAIKRGVKYCSRGCYFQAKNNPPPD